MTSHRHVSPAARPIALALTALATCLEPGALCAQEAANLGAAAGYALLGLQNGTVSVNSGSIVTGDFGYSAGVVSTTNQKLGEHFGDWTGTAYVHSNVAAFASASNFQPTGGIVTNAAQDARLDAANADVLDVSAHIAELPATGNLGVVLDQSVTLGSVDGQRTLHVIDVASLSMNSDVLGLVGDPDDVFVFRIHGDFRFSQSTVQLTGGLTAGHVLFYFMPNGNYTRNVLINKSATNFQGTILAPNLAGNAVEYHNPATFRGAIIAQRIVVHSDFSLVHVPFNGLICDGPQAAVNTNLPACGAAPSPALNSSLPIIGQTLQLSLASQLPNSLVVVVASLTPAQPTALPSSPCTFYVDLTQQEPLIPLALTNGNGEWSFAAPLPAHCKLVGLPLTMQAVVISLTPGPVPYIPGFLSNGLAMVIGLP